jgi:DNA-binding NtrC family response regulator
MSIIEGKKILIVDDDLGCREAITHIVRAEGASAITADSGESALHVLREKEVDLITTGIYMPGMNGLDLCKEIKKRGITTPIVVISGGGTLRDANELMKLGILNFMGKPFNVNDIISGLEKALMDKTQK